MENDENKKNWIDDILKNTDKQNKKEIIDEFNDCLQSLKKATYDCFDFYENTEMSDIEKIAWVRGITPQQMYHLIPIWFSMWKEKRSNGEKTT